MGELSLRVFADIFEYLTEEGVCTQTMQLQFHVNLEFGRPFYYLFG